VSLAVQTIIQDALLKCGVTTQLDAGDPNPEWLTIGLHELQMLLGEWNCNLTINNSQRTYSFLPQALDRIVCGDVSDTTYSATYGVTIPAASPHTYQLPNTNIQELTVAYVTSGLPLQNIVSGTPIAGQVLVNYSTGFLTFAAADAQLLTTAKYTWRSSEGTHPDIYESPMDIQSVSFELGNLTYPCRRVSYNDYQKFSMKQTLEAIPLYYAWDAQYPQSNIFVWPQISSNMTARVVLSRAFVEAEPQSDIDLPSHYYKAMVYNLATQIYTNFPTGGLDSEIIYHARASLEGLKTRQRRARTPRAVSGYRSRTSPGSMFTSPGSPLGSI